MTVEVVRRTRRRVAATRHAPEPTVAPAETFQIGEIGQTIFDCPSCSRPLAFGSRRCPGCGALLVNGVTAGKASLFVAIGLAVGLVVGGGGGFLFASGGPRAAAGGPLAAAPSADPGATPDASAPVATSAIPTATPAGLPDLSPATRAALVQVVATNDRLAGTTAALRATLNARTFDPTAVAQILRSVSADSVIGQTLADRVAGSSATTALGAQLASFYAAIHDTAANGLLASVQNRSAYRAAATAMIRLLNRVGDIDAAVRSTAAATGVELPGASGAPTAP